MDPIYSEILADLRHEVDELDKKCFTAAEAMVADLLGGVAENILNYAALLYQERELATLLKRLNALDGGDTAAFGYVLRLALESARDTVATFQPSASGNPVRDVIFNSGVHAGMQATLATLRHLSAKLDLALADS